MKNVEKKDRKLRKFWNEHKGEILIVGGIALGAVAVYVGFKYIRRFPDTIDAEKSIEKLAAKDENVAKLLDTSRLIDAGTRKSVVWEPATRPTVSEFFEDYAEFMAESLGVQTDDMIANVIYNIAKKPET